MSVVIKKDEKVKSIFEIIGENASLADFKNKFIEMYPKDWERIQQTYKNHERKDAKHKGHPMPKPEKYIENMYKVGQKKK